MDQKQLHEKATEILAKVMDLSYEDAMRTINQECGEEGDLKERVLILYKEISDINVSSSLPTGSSSILG